MMMDNADHHNNQTQVNGYMLLHLSCIPDYTYPNLMHPQNLTTSLVMYTKTTMYNQTNYNVPQCPLLQHQPYDNLQ